MSSCSCNWGTSLKYVLIKNGLTDQGKMIAENEYRSLLTSTETDFYRSLFYYDETHLEAFKNAKSFAGFKGLLTNRLYFDFDNEDNLDSALKDTRALVSKLGEDGIPGESIQICFSGKKGFSVEVNMATEFSAASLRLLATSLAGSYDSFDTVIYNDNRIIREVFTKHPDSGLYKKPITKKKFWALTASQMKEEAAILDAQWSDVASAWSKKIKVPAKYAAIMAEPVVVPPPPTVVALVSDSSNVVDYSKKPVNWTNCKWSLLHGHFGYKQGERHEALTILAATLKSFGYDKQTAYYLCKSAIKKQAELSGRTEFSTDELWLNILEKSVYSENWQGGAYTCRKPGWLQTYCQGLGAHSCNHDNDKDMPITMVDLRDSFKEYVKNIDKNTVKTGIKSIDDKIFLSTGSNVQIIGAAGSGKSSIALEILNNTSKAGVKSVFASLDMAKNRMLEKVLYRISGDDRPTLYQKFRDDKEQPLFDKLKEEFGNVNFYSKSSPTVQEVRDYILRCQEESGEKIKLVIVDYIERLSSDFDEETQASKRVAGDLQDMVSDLDICLITLVQPTKASLQGGPDSPIYDYRAIKGSSFLYQSARQIISIWRPMFNAHDFENDRYMKGAILKNDLGELGEFSLSWDGARSKIGELTSGERLQLESFLAQKEEQKKQDHQDRLRSGQW